MKTLRQSTLVLFVLCFILPVQAKLITRYALLIGIGQYPEGSGWPRLHGDRDVDRLGDELKKHHFLPNNIITLQNEQATRDEILAAIFALSRRVQSEDMVYIHFSGHFQHVTDLDGDEMDKLDEAFVAYDGLRNKPGYDGSGHLTDDLLAKGLSNIQERLTRLGQMVLLFDGGFSDDQKTHILPVRGTHSTAVISPGSVNFRASQRAASHDNELMDYNFETRQALTISINAGKAANQVTEVIQGEDTLGPLSAAFLHLLQKKEQVQNFKNAAGLMRSEMKTISPGLVPEIEGELDLDFLDKEPRTTKGFTSIKRNPVLTSFAPNNQVYALCVGASNYPWEKDSPKRVRYGHSDARSFHYTLQSAFGSRLVNDSTYLLLNERATQSRVFQALEQLKHHVSEGDVVYFYFAGHGDVEGSLITKPTFLLLPDGPQQSYSSGGHIPFDLLRNYINTFIFNGAHVFMVVDACRSGSLAGGADGGAETYANLRNLDQESVKILGCHPSEKSEEGEMHGGGFGALTWYLLKGLTGADKDKNNTISVKEIGSFLEDSVAKATRNRQNPVIEGPENAAFMPKPRHFSAQAMAARKKQTLTAEQDSILKKNEALFYTQLKKQNLIEPAGSSAYHYLEKLENAIAQDQIAGKPWRNELANAITDKSQQIINQYIAGNEGMSRDTVFRLGVRELNAWMKIKNPADPLYNNMVARRYFFEARSVSPVAVDNDVDRAELGKAINKLRISLRIESQTAHIHNAMGRLFAQNRQYDSALAHYYTAIALAPRWKFPYNNKGAAWQEKAWDGCKPCGDSAIAAYERSLKLDPKYALALKNLGYLYYQKGEKDRGKEMLNRARTGMKSPEPFHMLSAIYLEEADLDAALENAETGLQLFPQHVDLMVDQGNAYLEKALKATGNEKDSLLLLAEHSFEKANGLQPNYILSVSGLWFVYLTKKDYPKAADYSRKAMALDVLDINYPISLTESLLKLNRLREAEETLLHLDTHFPKDGMHHALWGSLHWRKKKPAEALESFSKAKKMGVALAEFEAQDDWAAFKKSNEYRKWQGVK